MPKRSTSRHRPSPLNGAPRDAANRPSPPAMPWEASHRRVTFYCPEDLLHAIEAEMVRSGRSKSRVIVDALQEHLERL